MAVILKAIIQVHKLLNILLSNNKNPTNPWDETWMNEKQNVWTKSLMLCFHKFIHKRNILYYYSYLYRHKVSSFLYKK